jgi:predicted nucleic acid-binding protein
MQRVLVDAGPLVALVSQRDQYHELSENQVRTLRPPLLTTWAVLAEAAWLVQRDPKARFALFELGTVGLYTMPEVDTAALPWLERFLRRYFSIRAQLADASLVYLAERDGIDTVFTFDRRDFSVYRFGRNRAFRILPEANA